MGFWKCVGCVAAFAVGGPLVGTVVTGAVIASSVKKGKEEARREGALAAHAEDAAKMKKMEDAMMRINNSLHEANDHYQLIIALSAIGMATANADGVVSQSEIDDMDEFISGISKTGLPEAVKSKLLAMRNNPPSFAQAVQEVKKLPHYNPADFRDVIELVSASDGCISSEERKLLQQWEAEF